MNNKYVIGTAIVALIAFAGLFLPSSDPVTPKVVERTMETLGSASSPSVVGGCMDVNGVQHCYYGQKMTTASTTCSFPLHNSASTTVLSAAATITNARGGLYSAAWGIGINPYATTTSLGYFHESRIFNNMVAVASTSFETNIGSNIGPAFVAGPNSSLNFKLGTTTHNVAG